MHSSIHIPDTCQEITVGSVVTLSRFPDTKWVTQKGWYLYEGQQYNGWYFSSIPAQTVIPMQATDLIGIVIISGGACQPIPHPPGPCPGPIPSPSQPRSVEKYLSGVSYVEGQLVWLETGVIYQVVEDFISSSASESVEYNLESDVKSGKLKLISAESVGYLSLLVKFKEVFGTDNPTKAEADKYLTTFNPEITPTAGIQFVNSDTESDTYNNIYQYLQIPGSDELIFQKLSGAKGDVGPAGPQGEKGDPGQDGTDGADGRGIVSVLFKNSTSGSTPGIAGATDTYEITYTDSTTSEFVVKNGESGSGSTIVIDTEMSATSENAVQNKVIKQYVDDIVGNIQTVLATVVEVTE